MAAGAAADAAASSGPFPTISKAGNRAESIIKLPALGNTVQLGTLYKGLTGELYPGHSLWNISDVNAVENTELNQVQNAAFDLSFSLDESRKKSGLDAEGSLALDLGFLSTGGSLKYLNDKQSSLFEARLDVSCTVVRRTRSIPQEKLAKLPYEAKLDDPDFTHYVAEVVEGGTATLSFVTKCNSAEEAQQISGKLKASFLMVSGEVDLSHAFKDQSLLERTKISYYGAMAENVSSLEDAKRIAHEMPTKLKEQMNTLSFTLVPVSKIDGKARRIIRDLDSNLIDDTAAAVKAGGAAAVLLREIQDGVLLPEFPAIKRQVATFASEFGRCETNFKQSARRLLPELRDGSSDVNVSAAQLRTAVTVFRAQTEVANTFAAKKIKEARVLGLTISGLISDGFENHLSPEAGLVGLGKATKPRLILCFNGDVNAAEHPLQSKLLVAGADSDESSDSSDDDEDQEWFETRQTVYTMISSCDALRQLRLRQNVDSPIIFAVASIAKAFPIGESKRRKTMTGDIVLDLDGKLQIVTTCLPSPPETPRLEVVDQSIVANWNYLPNAPIPVSSLVLRYRPEPNPALDGLFSRIDVDGIFKELKLGPSENSVRLDNLLDNADYHISMCVDTIVGRSEWSNAVVARTAKRPSEASLIIDFFFKHSDTLSKTWTLTTDDRPTLYLGNMDFAERALTDSRFKGERAVRIVDVAPEYKPEIKAAKLDDFENTKVLAFVGTTGHGKSTQINAFISYLLGGDLGDAARIMLIDDRGSNQAVSVTKYVTCYRIRPLSPLFEGKTLVIVDTPGYGDTSGIDRDRFITAAMSEFFKTISHVNAVVFTCRASETRTTVLSPVATYVFSLFAKDVRGCLRTIYTFSDFGEPQARTPLKQLEWPVDNGEVEVNNAAFAASTEKASPKLKDWWQMSMNGQHEVLRTLMKMSPVPTDASAQVTTDRLNLERRCELVEKKVLQTANDAQQLISDLSALANAVGAAPGEKVQVTIKDVKEEDVPYGKATTLCLNCNITCHEICALGDDNDKFHCSAMDSNGYCNMCPNHCYWNKHKNAKFILKAVSRTDWVVPEDLIKRWNKNNVTMEGALLDAIAKYLNFQKELCDEIIKLAELTEKLKNTALLHSPEALINYVESLIVTSRARGAPPEQLAQLTTAKNMLIVAREVKEHGADGITFESRMLQSVLKAVQDEMSRRMRMEPKERAKEEEKSCNLYNTLFSKLPRSVQKKAPAQLQEEKSAFGVSVPFMKGASYPDNLKAVVNLVQLLLKDSGVVAALGAC